MLRISSYVNLHAFRATPCTLNAGKHAALYSAYNTLSPCCSRGCRPPNKPRVTASKHTSERSAHAFCAPSALQWPTPGSLSVCATHKPPWYTMLGPSTEFGATPKASGTLWRVYVPTGGNNGGKMPDIRAAVKKLCVQRSLFQALHIFFRRRMNSKTFSALGRRVTSRLKVPSEAERAGSLDVSMPHAAHVVPTLDDLSSAAAAHAGAHASALDRLAHAISALPLDAFRAIDLWSGSVLQVAAATSTLAPHLPGMYAQFDECLTTARLWTEMKTHLAARCAKHVLPALTMDVDTSNLATGQLAADVDATMQAFRNQYAACSWLYHAPSAMLFELVHGGVHVQILNTLCDAMREVCSVRAAHAALTVNLAMSKVHDALLESGRTLRIDSRILLFRDTIITMASDGLALRKVDALPVIDVLAAAAPVAARCFVDVAFVYEPMMPVLAHDVLLLEVLGAVLRPSVLRREDLRPVCVLLTGPAHMQHPWIRAIETLVDLAIIQYTPGRDVRAPSQYDPYVLCVNCMQHDMEVADVHALHTALARNVAVVIVSNTVPAVLLHGDANDAVTYLRLVTVHVPLEAADAFSPLPSILMQSQTAYNRGKARGAMTHGFVRQDPRLRLNYMQSAHTLLLEMLQASDLCIMSHEEAPLSLVVAAYSAYCVVRCGTAGVPPCTAEQVLRAAAGFRDLFGQSASYPIVAYDARKAVFKQLRVKITSSE